MTTSTSSASPKPKLRTGTVVRAIIGVVAIVVAVSLALTQLTSVDASSCETFAKNISTEGSAAGAMPKLPNGAPVYLEVMSGDNELNRKLRAGLEEHFKGHEIVERAARHAPKNAVGAKLIVTMWAPKWFPFRASGTTQIESALRIGGAKREMKAELTSLCTGMVNKDGFLAAEHERMLEWARTSLQP